MVLRHSRYFQLIEARLSGNEIATQMAGAAPGEFSNFCVWMALFFR